MLAHELRNPLGAISNAVQVLELTHAEGEPATRAHEVIARQVGHISHLINDLLDVERVVSGKIRLNRQPLDLAEAVRRAVATFTGDAPAGSAHRRQHRAGVGRWGRRAARAGADQHRDQRGQVHAARRPDSRDAPRRRRRRRAQRRGHRVRHLARAAALHLRPVRAGRSDARPRAGRPRHRPDARPPPRRAARGHDRGVERGRRARQQVHRPAEADSCGRNVRRVVSSRRNVARSPGACC